jgi:hypothetical protein
MRIKGRTALGMELEESAKQILAHMKGELKLPDEADCVAG